MPGRRGYGRPDTGPKKKPPLCKGGTDRRRWSGGLTALSYIIDTSCRVWGFWLGALNPPGGAGRHPPLHKRGFFAALHTTSFSETLVASRHSHTLPGCMRCLAQVLRQRDAGPITFFALSGCICSGEEGMAVPTRDQRKSPPCAKGGQTAEGGQGD